VVQPVITCYSCTTASTGYTAAINSSTKFEQRYGYFEWSAQIPHDTVGEGDGLHPDIYVRPYGENWQDPTCQHHGEIDVAEEDVGTGNQTYIYNYSNEGSCGGFVANAYPSSLPGGQTLGNSFHTYGLYWQNDGSAHGAVRVYFDGGVATSPFWLNNTGWDNGIFFIISMDPCVTSAFGGGNVCTANTSNNNPFMVQYMRAWQLEPN
jgi:hypothetical protein